MGYQGINTFVCSTILSARAFLSHGNIVGVTIFTGEVYGVPIFATVTKFEITILEVSKLQKNNTPKFRITCTLCRSVA